MARGWSIHEMSARTGIAAGHLSRIENGLRPPTLNIATKCDAVFPERKGWFTDFYEESRTWAPAGFRSWAEYEDMAADLRLWMPGIVHGLVQTEAYAHALLATSPGATEEMVNGRLRSRMERQRRVLMRDDPPAVFCVVDHIALYRCVRSPEVMAAQMRHLAATAAMPNVTMQVLPAVEHPATASGLVLADGAAYAEHVAGGFTYTDDETVSSLTRLFTSIHSECYRASESLAIIRKAEQLWNGASQATAAPTAGTA